MGEPPKLLDRIRMAVRTRHYSIRTEEAYAYLRALTLAPNEPDVLVALAYFYDAVMDDPARAKPLFERATAASFSPELYFSACGWRG